MTVPNIFANGPGNVPDADLVNANFAYLLATPLMSGGPVIGPGLSNGSIIGTGLKFVTDAAGLRYAAIQSYRGTDSAQIDLRFYTMAGDGGGIIERMRISNTGDVTVLNGTLTTNVAFLAYDKMYFKTDGSALILSVDQTKSLAVQNAGLTATGDLAVTGDLYTTVITDYSGASTVTGWSSTTTKNIRYKKIGKTLHVWFFIQGTSNTTGASFTLPVAQHASTTCYFTCGVLDNGLSPVAPALGSITAGSSTVNFSKDNSGATFTGSNTKAVFGYFTYEGA